jgi:peptidoglycan/xylan/chitin deacetylase (PgdA/CDA1 family)
MQAVDVKRALVSAVTQPWVAPIFTPLLRGAGAVLMLHRIADPKLGNAGHDPQTLRANLQELRREGRELVSLAELVRRVQEDDLGSSSPIAFTVDDGYADFATAGAPIFAEFDCPVTVFLVSGVLDGLGWYWWDRIEDAFRRTDRTSVLVRINEVQHSLSWFDDHGRQHAAAHVIEACKLVSDEERLRVVATLPDMLEVSQSALPPASYAPMTWDDARACGRLGMTFGAHTVTHPILSRQDAATARWEIETSWRRLKEESLPVTDIFCYPNGEPQDFTRRESVMLAELGFRAAFTTTPGYVTAAKFQTMGRDAAYLLPRFAFPRGKNNFTQISSGFARAKLALREVGLA